MLSTNNKKNRKVRKMNKTKNLLIEELEQFFFYCGTVKYEKDRYNDFIKKVCQLASNHRKHLLEEKVVYDKLFKLNQSKD